MSNSNSIRLTLNIKDQNITFKKNYLNLEVINKVQTQVYMGDLIPPTPNAVKSAVLEILILL